MLSGTPTIDVDEWVAHTQYRGGFQEKGADHPVVAWFWECLRAMSADRQAQLLQWTTGHARVPVQGFGHLMGRDGVLRKFTLTSIELDAAIYPRAHTCFNRIDVLAPRGYVFDESRRRRVRGDESRRRRVRGDESRRRRVRGDESRRDRGRDVDVRSRSRRGRDAEIRSRPALASGTALPVQGGPRRGVRVRTGS